MCDAVDAHGEALHLDFRHRNKRRIKWRSNYLMARMKDNKKDSIRS
jgi:hypothetical protein